MSTEYLQRHYSAQGSFVKNYDPQRGWLTSKVYADGKATGYTYTDGGRLHTRTWARQVDSQPLTTTYGYNAAGDLTSTVYSDSTPAVAITYNRLGQKLSAGNSASQIGYTYNEQLRVEGELMTNGGFFTSFKHYYDALGRPSGLQSGDAGVDAVSYGYDAAGRLATVSPGDKTFTYAYVPNSAGLIASLTGPVLTGTQPVITVANTWEATRDVLASKENRDANGNVVSQYDYVVNNLGQRVSVQHSGSAFAGNAFNLYGYDGMGQLTSANRFNGNDRGNTQNPITGQQFGFAFDNIGNRLTATDGLANTSYTPNTLNQYSAIQSGTVAAVAPTYDADGNTLSDGTLVNQWDGENRLVTVTKPDGTQIACAYDAQSRRVRKTVTASGGVVLSDTAYLYDVWNLVAEYDLAPANATAPALLATNTWGIDLSGSPQGAGGVGGLLSRNTNGTTYAYTFDGNGNVSETLDTAGMAAHYEYGPFGEPLRVSGAMAGQNPFRFSTKYTDDETGLLYYGYRYYNPSTGRWISRDPLGDLSFFKQQMQNKSKQERKMLLRESLFPVYAFTENTPINAYDIFGLEGTCGVMVVRALDPEPPDPNAGILTKIWNFLEDAFTSTLTPHAFVILSDGTRLTNGGTADGEDHWTAISHPIVLNAGISCQCFNACMKKNFPNGSNYNSVTNNCIEGAISTISKCGGMVVTLGGE